MLLDLRRGPALTRYAFLSAELAAHVKANHQHRVELSLPVAIQLVLSQIEAVPVDFEAEQFAFLSWLHRVDLRLGNTLGETHFLV